MDPRRAIAILTYHSLDDSGSVLSTPPRVFAEQMRRLKEWGVKVVSLDTVAQAVVSTVPYGGCVAITFDDGFKNIHEYALPVLHRYGFTATIFLVPHYCGKNNSWPSQWTSIPRGPLLSWVEIGEMGKYGIDVGAHTLTHPDLTKMPLSQAEEEITQSKKIIEDHVGTEIRMFAYPYGRYDSGIREIVRKHFAGACTTRLGRNDAFSDPYGLRRVDMYYLSHPALFRALSSKVLDGYLGIRQVLREAREIFRS
jgi:peptidoglycan/xylan/chitin deacetylase (PgdA/CDA1 family)